MQLRFLGQAYSADNYQVETIASAQKGQFLGQTYSLRRPVQTFTPQRGLRKYSGLIYGR